MNKSKSISHYCRGTRDFFHMKEEEGVPSSITSLHFRTEEDAVLAQALYNCLIAEDRYHFDEFSSLIKYVSRLAGVNKEWW